MMNIPPDVQRAVGAIAAQSVWLELVAASFYARGLDEATKITARPGRALERGAKAAERLPEGELKARATTWLVEARRLLEEYRHPIVHGLAHYDAEGRWHTVHAKTGQVRALDATMLQVWADVIDHHAGKGWGIAWEIWRPADSMRTDAGLDG